MSRGRVYETGVNEWGDPYPILKDDKTPDEEQAIRNGITTAVRSAYYEQVTVAALEYPVGFTLEDYTIINDRCDGVTCEFTVTKILRGTPVTQYTGTVELYDDAPNTVTFDSLHDMPDIADMFSRLRSTINNIIR